MTKEPAELAAMEKITLVPHPCRQLYKSLAQWPADSDKSFFRQKIRDKNYPRDSPNPKECAVFACRQKPAHPKG